MGDGIGDFAFWLAVGLMGLSLFYGPIGKAVGRWIENHSGGASRRDLKAAVERLEARLAELDVVEPRLLEVEERLDFAERVLTGGRPAQDREVDTPPEPAESVR
jgi:hypothetical protein